MESDQMRCMRCRGRKKVYKTMGGYSHTNSGGVEVQCPMCLGVGTHKKPQASVEVVEKKLPHSKKKKELDNGTSN